MRVTSEADYALRIMRCLAKKVHDDGCGGNCESGDCKACDCGGKLDAKTISEMIEAPQRFTVKILRKLLGGGLIKSFKGAAGGYTLSQPAETISVRMIVELIDGPFEISRCLNKDYECTGKHNGCYFHRMFARVNANIAAELEAIKLSDAIK